MSHNSPRSLRTKAEARQRPDVVWQYEQGYHEEKLTRAESKTVLSGGSELSQLIAQSDAHLSAMRKIVQ